MNRAILIVICDFIVSAMLSFYTSAPPAAISGDGLRGGALDHRTARLVLAELRHEQARLQAARQALLDAQFAQGFSEERAGEIKQLTEQLAEAQARSEFMERKLAQTPQNSGALSPEELQKQLEGEIKKRLSLNLRHQDAVRELEHLRESHRSTSQEYAALRETYAARQAELDQTRKILEEREKKLSESVTDLSVSKETLAAREASLVQTREELLKISRVSAEYQEKTRETETALSFARGRLSAVEQELAEARSRIEKDRKDLSVRELELAEQTRKLQNMETVLKTAVSDLSRTRAALAEAEQSAALLPETRKQAELAQAELASLRHQLAAAEEKLRSDVLKRYSDAVLRVHLRMRETRLLLPHNTDEEYYLPLINLNGRTCLIGDFLLLTGNYRERLNFDNVTYISFAVSPAEGGGGETSLPGPLYSPRNEARVGLLETEGGGRLPLEVMPLSRLKERGLQDLYLFKHSAFGKESSSLEGRCSLNFVAGDEYLYIRNASRGTGSELKAEPGDFVLTKQGEFVAVVVANESFDLGRRQEARCVVFPDNFDWNEVFVIPLLRSGGAPADFVRAAQPVISAIRSREAGR